MKFGVVFQPTYVPDLDGSSAAALATLLDDAVRAERLGFDVVWATEHHFQAYGGLMSAPAVFLAAASQRTQVVRLGVAVALLPLRDPVRTAEEFATLDALSGGRLEFGIGRGFSRWDYHVFGFDLAASAARLKEALDVVLAAWSQDTVTFHGDHFRYDGVAVLPRPAQQPCPRIWVAAATRAETFVWAGQRGYRLMVPPFQKDHALLRRHVAMYQAAFDRGGHNATHQEIFAIIRVHVAETTARAYEQAETAHYRYLGLQRARDASGDPFGRPAVPDRRAYARDDFPGLSLEELSAGAHLIVGSPDDCVAAIQVLNQRLAVTHLGGIFAFGGLAPDVVTRSMELFATAVIPRVRSLDAVDVRLSGEA